MWQKPFYIFSALISCIIAILAIFLTYRYAYLFIIIIPFIIIGIMDAYSYNNVLYNYPVIGHIRYLMEFISPEIRQYFLEDDKSGRPYNREQRYLIQIRGLGKESIHPFGTEQDINSENFNFILHSIAVKQVPLEAARVIIGGPDCSQPYNCSRLNISAMSFGSLSSRAILAMNKGAKLGNFFQDTGEGGLTAYHLEYGADLVWEIGSGYFGCRTAGGSFNDEEFRTKSNLESVKMISIKLSQGAKPGHGGILPGIKVSKEIANFRGVLQGVDCKSPDVHPEFNSPIGLLEFVQRLRKLCRGKPVGFKLCIGKRKDFLAICKAMLKTNILPDFIVVDGAEGGTGAAPNEFSDYLGMYLNEALPFVHHCLIGCKLRNKISLIASGKIVDGFDMLQKIALGADICSVARPMMFAVGCIQAMRCHTGHCPTGVTTQDPKRVKAIHVDTKALHVKNYHNVTINSFLKLVGALGIDHPNQLNSSLIWTRIANQQVITFAKLFPEVLPGALLYPATVPDYLAEDWQQANAEYY